MSTLEQISEKGIQVPEGTPEEVLVEVLSFIQSGSKQNEINEMFFPSQKSPDAPKGKGKQPKPERVFGEDEVKDMIAKATQEAVAAALSGAGRNITVVESTEDKRPQKVSKTAVPKEFWNPKTFRVYVSGNNFHVNEFQVKGRKVDIPMCKILPFVNDQGRGTRRFGDSHNLVYRAYFDTNDQRLIDLFMSDDRMGSQFWTEANGASLNEQEKLSSIAQKYMASLSTAPYEQVRGMMVDMGRAPGNSLEEMRTIVATQLAKNELADMKAKGLYVDPEAAKEKLMR